ncbi:nucleotide exchange factor GrpE [Streptomyces sp. TRM64462]|uniref:nucleotide exchange factor GrpE n=1 Tax=Streptomyces sp. TRM64462 TaxID=2741726 RepID=UPI002815AF1E|nr:nucleotide exchange factor GrpE [Streptomyces sp. TRM64462]
MRRGSHDLTQVPTRAGPPPMLLPAPQESRPPAAPADEKAAEAPRQGTHRQPVRDTRPPAAHEDAPRAERPERDADRPAPGAAPHPGTAPRGPDRKARQARDAREGRNARETGNAQEGRDEREALEAREAREVRDVHEGPDGREVRHARDTRQGQELREAREPREARDVHEGPDGRDVRHARDARQGQHLQEAREPREARDVHEGPDGRKVRHARDARQGQHLQEARDGQEGRDGQEARDGQDAREQPVPGAVALGVALAERTADLRRVKAEFDNYRARVHRDRLAVGEVAVANVLRRLLPVLDAVREAGRHGELTDGFLRVADMLEDELAALGLTTFGAAGEPFDPRVHTAVAYLSSPAYDRPVCTEVIRPGHRVGDHLLRPAEVTVTGPPAAR